jgi:hypothetical protein
MFTECSLNVPYRHAHTILGMLRTKGRYKLGDKELLNDIGEILSGEWGAEDAYRRQLAGQVCKPPFKTQNRKRNSKP